MKQSTWALVRGVKDAFETLKADIDSIDQYVWHRWLIGITILWLLTALLMVGMVFLTKQAEQAGWLGWEREWVNQIIQWGTFSFSTLTIMATVGNGVFVSIIAILSALTAIFLHKPLRSLSLLSPFFLLGPVVMLGWTLWSRARPELAFSGVATPSYSAFPSGHVAFAIGFHGFLYYLWYRQSKSWLERFVGLSLYLAFLSIIIYTRLALSTHWPTDIFAGALLGLLWLVGLIWLLNDAQQRQHSLNDPGKVKL